MLCGFKNMLLGFIFIYACHLRNWYILLFRLASQRGLHPSRLVGCWFKSNSYNVKAALCGYQASWRLGETLSLSFGLQAWRGFQASSGPLGGTEALTRVHLQAQGANCWEEPSSQPSGSTEEASRSSVSFF